MSERLYELWMHIVCPRCGRIRNPFKGYYQLCNRCEKIYKKAESEVENAT